MPISTERLHAMTYSEIDRRVWKGVPPHKAISLNERLGPQAVVDLIDHPSFDFFPEHFRSWIWTAIDAQFDAQE